jgi:signal transduction histidine kinase
MWAIAKLTFLAFTSMQGAKEMVLRRRYRRVLHFLKQRTGSEWQQAFASVGILGTAATLALLTVCLTVAWLWADNLFACVMLPYIAAATVLAGLLLVADKQKRTAFGGLWLIVLYLGLGTAMACRVGLGAGAAILFSMALILASALYGLWLALVPTEIIALILVVLRINELHGNIHPVYIFVPEPHSFETVVAIMLMLHVLVFACGIVHHYLVMVNQRLQEAEAERMEQLYRFAEIGEISTALIHDLANNLGSLTLEIDDIKAQTGTQALAHAKKKVRQLDTILSTARDRINGRHSHEKLDLTKEITRTVTSMRLVAQSANVTLEWRRPRASIRFVGEKVLFQQVLTILIKNAIDSYPVVSKLPAAARRVRIELSGEDSGIRLSVTDWGRGIKAKDRERIFQPFFSTKKEGMGMGLYLTKRFIEDSFGGTITLETEQKQTAFLITLINRKKTQLTKT